MGFLDRFLGKNPEKVAELMKSLCLDFAADIYNTVLPKAEIPEKCIDIIEPIILGMFLVGTIYKIKHSDSQKSREQIDMFYDAMENFLCNDIYLKSSMPKDITSINTWISAIKYATNLRFNEYPKTFMEDFQRRPNILNTIKVFSEHLFIESVVENKLNTFNMLASMIFMIHMDRFQKEL